MLLYRLWRRSVYKVFWTFRSWGYCNSDFVMSEKFPIAEYISLLYLGVLVLVISAFWFCLKVFGSICRGWETILYFIWEYRAYGIGVLSVPNLSFIPMKFCIVVVCLFQNACLSVSSARFFGRVCRWSCLLFEAYPGLFRSYSTSFWNFFHLFPSVFWWC